MRSRLDPWPAIADLFSGLLIATFGSVMLFTHLAGKPDPVDVESRRLRDEVLRSLQSALAGQQRSCGDDVCLDVSIEFGSSRDAVLDPFRARLGRACQALKSTLGQAGRRDEMEIFVEGHTDYRPPTRANSERDRDLYNWNLSARRATSVLYEFRQCGVSAPPYRMVAIGYADTIPLCSAKTPECLQKNRRTTFRLRPDKTRIEARLKRR